MNGHTGRPTSGELIEVSLDEDVMLEMLCNGRRRHTVRHLLSEGNASLTDVVDRIADAERDGDSDEIPRDVRKSVSVPHKASSANCF